MDQVADISIVEPTVPHRIFPSSLNSDINIFLSAIQFS